ncbi:MAG: phosphate acyltransferase PlsX [Acholeplasmatales bacterium]|jgi:glycerol-3-phosphate acyltransferase PlsX|nr:phosphate acyltransferase PlsX [Acholeplasmatales bacterium]
MIKIGVDAMGGDYAPEEIIKGVNDAIKKYSDIEITLYGDSTKITPLLINNPRVSIVHTTDAVSMGEKDPISVVRNNKTASMILALNDLKEKKNSAVVSAGPTQVLVVAGSLIVKKTAFMRRVALAAIIPSLNSKGKVILDTGANTSIDPIYFVDLAVYGSELAKRLFNLESPKVALLNIGTEKGKGREVDKQTYELLEKVDKINFIGNIEGKEILNSEADIILQDGWSNNIAIKTLEGTAKASGEVLKKEIKASFWGKVGYIFMRKSLKRYKETFNTSKVGGACILGLNGIVVKAHGSSDAEAITSAIRQARELVASNIIKEVDSILEGYSTK